MANRFSLKNRREKDGPIQVVPENPTKFSWVSSSTSSVPQYAVCVDEGYVGRSLGHRGTFVFGLEGGHLPISNNNGNLTNYQILTDPQQKAEWKRVTGEFNPDSCNAFIANRDKGNETNIYIGKVTYETGDCAVGTILRSPGAWKFRHPIANNHDNPMEIALNGAGCISCEVLCEKN
ncbi:hypothetical protein Ocin01_18477 [Orchesella cincta]|uniref:Uncharacterized protein n=1 Tax=Orchesella cincta TaxID=48709 RepID=A0A1D2M5F2_ORCCI|nr:hypothetical protein Ocin01_18477 [Orchesella cincta]